MVMMKVFFKAKENILFVRSVEWEPEEEAEDCRYRCFPAIIPCDLLPVYSYMTGLGEFFILEKNDYIPPEAREFHIDWTALEYHDPDSVKTSLSESLSETKLLDLFRCASNYGWMEKKSVIQSSSETKLMDLFRCTSNYGWVESVILSKETVESPQKRRKTVKKA